MRKVVMLFVLAILGLTRHEMHAQEGYFENWFDRADKTAEEQPHWVVPVATSTARIVEAYRYDQLWQNNAKRITTDIYDGNKGLELVPLEKVAVILQLPPYINHNNRADKNGWGDVAFLAKYRLLSANEEHGNYILTAFLGWSLPTGQYSNGALHAVITPTVAYGKGFGDFDVQGTFGATLPVASMNLVGRSYLWNNTFQCHLLHRLWPEVELNSTFFQQGKYDGMKQNFVTPGLVVGRFHLLGRIALAVGGGYQIATTHFHTNNHNAILAIRFPF